MAKLVDPSAPGGGDKHLHYAKSADILADSLGMLHVNEVAVDPTVGGTHLTDLGMRKQAAFWSKYLGRLLNGTRAASWSMPARKRGAKRSHQSAGQLK